MATDKTITITASVPIVPVLTTKVVTATVSTPTTTVSLNEVDTIGVVVEKVGNLYVNLTGYGEEAIPSPTLVKYNQDLFNAIETFRKDLLKSFIESKSISDLAYWLFSRNQLENITTIEVFTTVTNFNRPLLEVASISERRQFEFYKLFLENASILEHININSQKLFSDSSTVADLISKVISPVKTETLLAIENFQKNVFKVFFSSSSISDLATLHPNKGIVDTVNLDLFIEVLSFEVSTILLDTIFTTDDVLGNANIDDDQYAFVQKRLIENTTLIETITTLVSFLRSFDENIALNDLFNLNFFKNEFETSNISETINKSYSKLILDSSYSEEMYGIPDYVASTYAIDTVSTSVNKGAVENLVTSDLFFTVVDFNRFVDQINSLADQIIFNFVKILNDTSAITETLLFVFDKVFEDNITTNDISSNSVVKPLENYNNIIDINYSNILPTYVEVLNLSEIISISQSNFYLDSNLISDIALNSVNKYLEDPIISSDFINLNLNAVLTDSVLTTDDVLGNANIDDDQYAFVNKVVRETLDLSDILTLEISFDRLFSDISTISQIISIIVNKALEDVTTTSESLIFSADKILADNSTVISTLSKSLAIIKSETTTALDVFSSNSTKNTNEVILTSEYKLAHVQDYFASNYVAIGYVGSYYTI